VVYRHPVVETGLADVLAGQFDGGGVEVVAVDADPGVRAGDADTRPARTTADVG
jgi:hypothetical protein